MHFKVIFFLKVKRKGKIIPKNCKYFTNKLSIRHVMENVDFLSETAKKEKKIILTLNLFLSRNSIYLNHWKSFSTVS